MPDPESPNDLRDELRTAWQRYIDLLAPLRPSLHGYCRRLAGGDVWDAEDLVQDTLVRAFAQLGMLGQSIRNPRAYLLRTASHAWIDTQRRRAVAGEVPLDEPPADPGADPARAGEARAAGERLLQRLAPQERAAVLLKDVFDLGLDEIAEILVTTPGAVKSALHRGRGRLREPDGAPSTRRPRPSPELVDRFLERYHAGDVKGLVALMLEGGSAENVGCGLQYGPDGFEGTNHFLYKAVHGHDEWPEALRPQAVRVLRGEYAGEPVVLCFATRRGEEALEQILRFDEAEGRIARLRGYAFCPETMRAVGAELGLPVRTGLYRYPTPAPGKSY